jgi:hypothetical protein
MIFIFLPMDQDVPMPELPVYVLASLIMTEGWCHCKCQKYIKDNTCNQEGYVQESCSKPAAANPCTLFPLESDYGISGKAVREIAFGGFHYLFQNQSGQN